MIRIAAGRAALELWRSCPAARPAVELLACEGGVEQVRAAVLAGRADAAMHLAEELPCTVHDRLEVVAAPLRGDVREALYARVPLSGLPRGATVAVSGPRRALQLAELRPDVRSAPLEGPLEAALDRVGRDLDGVIAPVSALDRLGRHPAETFTVEQMVPAPGQGSLLVEARGDDRRSLAALRPIDHAQSRLRIRAERAVLQRLPGWAPANVGVTCELRYGWVTMHGVLATGARRPLSRARRAGPLLMEDQIADALASALVLQESGGIESWA